MHHVDHFLLCVGLYIGRRIVNILYLDPMEEPSPQTRSTIATFFEKMETGGDEIKRVILQTILKVCHPSPFGILSMNFQSFFHDAKRC